MFAEFTPKNIFIYTQNEGSYFYGYTFGAVICIKIKRSSIHRELLHLRALVCSLARMWRGGLSSFITSLKFSFTMPKNNENVSVANNSSYSNTSTHETGTVNLSGNPFSDLAAFGINLHACSIRYSRGGNRNGNTITGRFNINGRETTAGNTSYEGLIAFIVQKETEYRTHVSLCHKAKRERCFNSWLSRHPEFTFNHCNVTINI